MIKGDWKYSLVDPYGLVLIRSCKIDHVKNVPYNPRTHVIKVNTLPWCCFIDLGWLIRYHFEGKRNQDIYSKILKDTSTLAEKKKFFFSSFNDVPRRVEVHVNIITILYKSIFLIY